MNEIFFIVDFLGLHLTTYHKSVTMDGKTYIPVSSIRIPRGLFRQAAYENLPEVTLEVIYDGSSFTRTLETIIGNKDIRVRQVKVL